MLVLASCAVAFFGQIIFMLQAEKEKEKRALFICIPCKGKVRNGKGYAHAECRLQMQPCRGYLAKRLSFTISLDAQQNLSKLLTAATVANRRKLPQEAAVGGAGVELFRAEMI